MNNTSSTKSRSIWHKLWFWILVLVLSGTTTTSFGAITALFAPVEPQFFSQLLQKFTSDVLWRKGLPYQLSQPMNILVMGIDQVSGVAENSPDVFEGRSDTLLLVQANPTTQTVSLLSVPRDTQVLIPKVGIAKINEANVYGGPELVESVLESTLSGFEIDRYVRVSKGAFRELVEQLGGVEIFVPQPMSYTDNTQQLKIDLKSGWQTLNGEQAEQFARFREEVHGDIGRIQRQQVLLKALRNRVTNVAVLPRLPHIIQVMLKYVDTNLSFPEMLALVSFSLDLERDDLRMVMLPGRASSSDEYLSSYWIIDQPGRDRILEQYFNFKLEDFNYNDLFYPIKVNETLSLEAKIAVQNASSNSQAATNFAQYLRDQGFYNVYVVSDWPDKEPLTQIIVQGGYLESAEVVKNALGFGNIEPASIGEIGSDFTVRLGEDSVEIINAFQEQDKSP
ncbi:MULTISPECIES: LCP family protein [Okeania]|uniref:LytR family transcriptional regulator n=1 Tax=Okeania hirsuta TaxID=1458930 RepID=A0A3N6P2A5_9CYAN|nr:MULTISPECIES: LCP family protein [Okeania]NES76300.1 LCP family protein [Okeania sp. SIO1H4]NES92741.1 LCP family protein [Okeania sp. SIO2B9]NET19744.1 LCP family protein [Okeania sp. SIO1H5]NET74577.1 LCP family protein [Okeania sp. SIO1F9]NET96341.1 LCP family protein [Okeania sp. SIO1H2]